ncbi:MAG: hypothetical protein AAF788_00620 [Pseudomonadota bacterium]
METFSLYADAVIVMTSLGAMLYCMRLSSRLKRFQQIDRGMGQAIKGLTDATESSRIAGQEIREQIRTSIEELDERRGTLKSHRQEIEDLLDTVDGQMGMQVRRCHEARELTERALTPLVHKAEVEIQALTKALEVSTRLAGLQASMGSKAELARLSEDVPPPAPQTTNPFLRAVGD